MILTHNVMLDILYRGCSGLIPNELSDTCGNDVVALVKSPDGIVPVCHIHTSLWHHLKMVPLRDILVEVRDSLEKDSK